MAIEKNSFKATSRFDPELSPNSGDTESSGEDELQRRVSAVVSESDDDEDDDELDDVDSGAGSDDFDLLELGEMGAEFCQVGSLTCSVPFELYDLPGLEGILSLDVWNEVLTEEERFGLTKYLPDLDQFMFMQTLKELFEGTNFHFGSPIEKLFEMLKGGLCEPRVALYREGFNFFQKRKHYHALRKHQNDMVSNFCQMRDAWLNCKGYSIEEKLRVLNIMKSHKSLMNEKMEADCESNSEEKEESGDGLWDRRVKDRRSAKKLVCNSACGVGTNLEFASRMPLVGLEVPHYGKQNPKGVLKLGGSKAPSLKEMDDRFSSFYDGLDVRSSPYRSAVPGSRQNKVLGNDSGASIRLRDQMRFNDDEDDEDAIYGMNVQQDQNMAHDSMMDKYGVLKAGKKHDVLRTDKLATNNYMGFPFSSKKDLHSYGRNSNPNQLLEVKAFTAKPPNVRSSYEFAKKTKYPENIQQYSVVDQMKPLKGRTPQLPPLKGNYGDLSGNCEPMWLSKNQGQVFTTDSSFGYDDWNMKSKKWKPDRESPDFNLKTYRASSPQANDKILLSELRTKPSKKKSQANAMQNGRSDKGVLRANRTYMGGEETESDSSDQSDDNDENSNRLMRSKSTYTSVMERSRSSFLKSGLDAKRVTYVKKDMQNNSLPFEGIAPYSKKVGGFKDLGHMPSHSAMAKQKGKMRESSPIKGSATRILEDSSSLSLAKFKGENDRKKLNKIRKNGHARGQSREKLLMSSLREVSHDLVIDEEDGSHETRVLADDNAVGRLGKKGQSNEAYVQDQRDKSEASLLGCNSVTKKWKAKEEVMDVDGIDEDCIMQSNNRKQIDDSILLKKKGKRKLEADVGTSDMETSTPPVIEMAVVDAELETKPQKKPYTPITPTVHTGFTFSIIHLLSAVRMAMIIPPAEESLELGKHREEQNRKEESGTNGVLSHENADVNKSDYAAEVNVPSLTMQEIVNRVKSNPGDPCILETQEQLQDLVRGVLKIFSSKTAPLGAKGWKVLVLYEKSAKGWSWVGPVSQTSTDQETIEEVTSPEYWGLPHKMLVKLVDSFANWLKNGQETLQQIGSLPAPPLSLMQCNLDEKERFRDLRAQKSLNTISPSSEEVRAYFRKEEVLRYWIPDRAFSYTAADGKKSIVAPLRRCGGKPTSKARDHFMLKRDRPPHVTILCLVRDAAARLPGSIGTRADVCTLIRDSQYIVEDVTDAQVNQVVSGALDRLHYERDPCVQFDGERKLWVYLHREREEEDFEDDGTSSTKKWKRQKKDPADQPEQGVVTVAFHGNGDQSGFDLGSDLNVEPPSADEDKRPDVMSNDAIQTLEDNLDISCETEQGNTHQDNPVVLPPLGLDQMQEDKLLCQENSTNEDFDDEAFGRERPGGLLSASLT